MIYYQTGYKYQLRENARFTLPAAFAAYRISAGWYDLYDGVLNITKGYAWDGASGPTADTKSTMQGALVHDVLYQMMREGLIGREMKDAADQLLHDMCVADGMNKLRAWLWHRAVKRFGLSSTIRNKDILCAP